MNIDILRKYILKNEGFENSVYDCSSGIQTIGVGFNLEKSGAENQISALGLDYNSVISGKTSLTEEQVFQLMEDDLQIAIADAKSIVKNSSYLSNERQIVLIDMSFNHGKTRLAQFVKMIAAVNANDFNKAANEMADSTWAKQVKGRAVRNILCMRSNILQNV